MNNTRKKVPIMRVEKLTVLRKKRLVRRTASIAGSNS